MGYHITVTVFKPSAVSFGLLPFSFLQAACIINPSHQDGDLVNNNSHDFLRTYWIVRLLHTLLWPAKSCPPKSILFFFHHGELKLIIWERKMGATAPGSEGPPYCGWQSCLTHLGPQITPWNRTCRQQWLERNKLPVEGTLYSISAKHQPI